MADISVNTTGGSRSDTLPLNLTQDSESTMSIACGPSLPGKELPKGTEEITKAAKLAPSEYSLGDVTITSDGGISDLSLITEYNSAIMPVEAVLSDEAIEEDHPLVEDRLAVENSKEISFPSFSPQKEIDSNSERGLRNIRSAGNALIETAKDCHVVQELGLNKVPQSSNNTNNSTKSADLGDVFSNQNNNDVSNNLLPQKDELLCGIMHDISVTSSTASVHILPNAQSSPKRRKELVQEVSPDDSFRSCSEKVETSALAKLDEELKTKLCLNSCTAEPETLIYETTRIMSQPCFFKPPALTAELPSSASDLTVNNGENDKDPVTNIWPHRGSFVNLNTLTADLIDLVDHNPQLFRVECLTAKMTVVRLIDEYEPTKLSNPRIRLTIESDLSWLRGSKTLQNCSKSDVICGSPLWFVPPRCVLAATISGNIENMERFNYLKKFFFKYGKHFKPAQKINPGMPCIVRLNNDIARAVVLSQPYPGKITVAFLDAYTIFTLSPSCIYDLPRHFDTSNIPCNLFLARIRGVKHISFDYNEIVCEMIKNNFNTPPTPLAGVIRANEDDICAVDFGHQTENPWLSDRIKGNFDIQHMLHDDKDIDYNSCHFIAMERYKNGSYNFNKSIHYVPPDSVKVAESFLQKAEDCTADSDRDWADSSENTLEATSVKLEQTDTEERPSDPKEEPNISPKNSSLSCLLISDETAQENVFDASHNQENNFFDLVKFVDSALLVTPESSRNCIIHNALSLAYFIKANVDSGDGDSMKQIDKTIHCLEERQ